MARDPKTIDILTRDYPYGFVTEIEEDSVPAGLSEDIIRAISSKKNEPDWMLEWRLRAYRQWLTLKEPTWANVHYGPIDYQAVRYYSAPKQRGDGPKSLAEVDPELLRTYERLGIPLPNGSSCPALPSMRFLTAYQWRRRFAISSNNSGFISARSLKPFRSIQTSFRSI